MKKAENTAGNSLRKARTLFHFTSSWHLGWILKDRMIWIGNVPTSRTKGFNAPWFTSDDSWSSQKWARRSKLQVRLTVRIPEADEKLTTWHALAGRHSVSKKWWKQLDRTGGGGAHNWYVYLGGVPINWITEITLHVALPGQHPFEVQHGALTPGCLETLRGIIPAAPPLPIQIGTFHPSPGFVPGPVEIRPMKEVMVEYEKSSYRQPYGFGDAERTSTPEVCHE